MIAYPLGIIEPVGISGIRVYPNPTRNDFKIEIPDPFADEAPFIIRLIDMNGKVVRETELNDRSLLQTTIDGHNLPCGVYSLFIQGRTKAGFARVIIAG